MKVEKITRNYFPLKDHYFKSKDKKEQQPSKKKKEIFVDKSKKSSEDGLIGWA